MKKKEKVGSYSNAKLPDTDGYENPLVPGGPTPGFCPGMDASNARCAADMREYCVAKFCGDTNYFGIHHQAGDGVFGVACLRANEIVSLTSSQFDPYSHCASADDTGSSPQATKGQCISQAQNYCTDNELGGMGYLVGKEGDQY